MVNTASRMTYESEKSKIQLCGSKLVKELKESGFNVQERGQIDIKGKGILTTYWLEQHLESPAPETRIFNFHQGDSPDTTIETITLDSHVGEISITPREIITEETK